MKKMMLSGLVLLLLSGCESTEDNIFETKPNIFALMFVEDSSHWQWIKVAQTYNIKDTVDTWGLRDALVKVWAGQDTFVFIDSFFDADSAKWFKYNEGWYGRRAGFDDTILYHLEVIMPWDDTVTAEAYMPTPIRIHTPADSDTVSISAQPVAPHVITWNSCKNTELYLIYCIPDVDTSELDNISPIFTLPSFTMDTSYTFFLQRMIAPWDFDMHYVLRVIAVSPEYADYMGMQGPGTSVSNLSSGYGMFGGTSEDSIRVYITE